MKRAATGGRGLRASASIACARVAACCLWAALALPAVAGAAPLGVTGEIVNPPGGSGLAGGEFSTASGSPGGVAVNDASGEIYTVSASANRVQRFDSSGNFISAFGADVISGAAAGTGTLNGTATVSAVVATSGAFLVGQKITGAGIPAGTRIVAANVGTGLNSTLTLSQAATASASGVALTVAAEPNNVPANELQTITVTASGGNFKLQASATQGFAQATSENIPHDAPVATVQSELEALPQIGAGNVEVTGAPGEYTVEYKGARADTDIAVFVVAGSPALSGGAATRTTVVEGGGAVELCTMASECKPGVGGSSGINDQIAAGGTLRAPQGIAINQTSGHLYVTNQGLLRVEELEADGGFVRAFGKDVLAGGGSEFEICEAAASCQTGTTAGEPGGTLGGTVGYPAVVPAGAPNAGNVLVPNSTLRRVEEFSASGAFVRAFGFDVVASGPGESGAGFEVCQAAVDVCKIGSFGTAVGQFGSTLSRLALTRVAADTSGAIYTVENAPIFGGTALRRVQKFTPQPGFPGLAPSVFAEALLSDQTAVTATPNKIPTDVAVDPFDDHVYVVKAYEAGEGTPPASGAERRVLEFDPAGNLVETHLANSGIASVNGLALQIEGERAYLSSSEPGPRLLELGLPTPPTPLCTEASAIGTDGATFTGTVNPNGGAPLETSYRFEFSGDGGASWTKATPTDTPVGSGESPVAAEDTVSGLQPNKEYLLRLVAIKGGAPTFDECPPFTTETNFPDAQTYAAFFDTSSEELVLRGAVNPRNSPTTYRFEYGTAACEPGPCESTAEKSAGAGGVLAAVAPERIGGLQPDTTYHYRILADGFGEPVEGSEGTIHTPPAQACANEAFRTGPSAALAECRAFEWVSGGDSWGLGITAPRAIGDDGNRAQFTAQAFGQPKSAPGPFNPYTSIRTASGWEVKAMLPDPDKAFGSKFGTTLMGAADLGATLWPEARLGERQRLEVGWGISRLDGSLSLAAPVIVPLAHGGAENLDRALEYPLAGATPDLSSFVFTQLHETIDGTGFKLLADEPLLGLPFRSNLYAITAAGPGAELSVVNRADGAAGAVIGGTCGAGFGGNLSPSAKASAARAISEDGSAIYFSAAPGAPSSGSCDESSGKRLYKRIDGETTVAVSAAQCACGGPGGDDTYQGASSDGEVAFFTTPRRLLASDTDNSADLYVHDADPPAGQPVLAQASAGEVAPGHPTPGVGAEVQRVLDSSADGSRAYFTAKGALTGANARGQSPVAGELNLYVYERDDAHPTGRVGFVGTLVGSDFPGGSGNQRSSFALPSGSAGDGHLFLFVSAAQLVGEDADASGDLYRYEDQSGELACLSCMGSGSEDVSVPTRNTASSFSDADQKARPASADVSAVSFTTAEGLVDEDLNGAPDAYLWREGALSLVSAGSGEAGARSAGISPDGQNVFFVTRTALVGADTNNGPDLYDARVGGGFAEAAKPVPCAGADSCQGPASGEAPGPEAGGSETFTGPGNVAPRKPCRKGHVRKKGRCVNKRHAHRKKAHKKRAGHSRRAKR